MTEAVSTFNLQEAEDDANLILRNPVQYGHALCNWSRDFLTLAALYREAEAELRGVDAALARRPALDRPTRAANIEKACARADEADRFEARYREEKAKRESAERDRDDYRSGASAEAKEADHGRAEAERLRALYREAVETLAEIRREATSLFDRQRPGMALGLIADRCDAVLAKAREASKP